MIKSKGFMVLLTFLACAFWLILSINLHQQLGLSGFLRHLFFTATSLFAVWLSQSDLWVEAGKGYLSDSFYDLSPFGRAGVITISALSILALYGFLAWQTRFLKATIGKNLGPLYYLPMDILLGLFSFAVLYALSPQLYYTFYQFIFPGLPTQIVVKGLFNVDQLIRIAQFLPGDSLSNHLSGLAFLGIIPFKIMLHFMDRPDGQALRYTPIRIALIVATILTALPLVTVL